jgi:DNA invertase Pin-like site-specific DNA recombinase
MAAARRGGKRIGYVRVSSLDQNEQRQLEGVEVDKKFTDKASGKDMNRPRLRAALEYLRDGDVLMVHSMDRLARNLDDLRKIVIDLTGRGVVVEFVKEHLTFTSEDNAMSKLLLSVMGAFAEFERALIKERQREGIALAKQKGVYKGRKPSLTHQQVRMLKTRAGAGEQRSALAREFGISRETLYQYLRANV